MLNTKAVQLFIFRFDLFLETGLSSTSKAPSNPIPNVNFRQQCEDLEGDESGSCADGFGVCCTCEEWGKETMKNLESVL